MLAALNESELEETFERSSGPGGQNVNKTSTKVLLRHLPTGITVTVQDQGGRARTIHRTVGSGGSFGGSPLRQHVGLGRGARTVSVDIWWPTSDTRQRFTGVAVNQTIEVTELARDYRTVTAPRLPLGRPAKEQPHVP